jgi:hypothetical protein
MRTGAAKAGGAPSQPIPRRSFHGDSQEALRPPVPPLRGLTHGQMLIIGHRHFVFEKRPPWLAARCSWEPECWPRGTSCKYRPLAPLEACFDLFWIPVRPVICKAWSAISHFSTRRLPNFGAQIDNFLHPLTNCAPSRSPLLKH